jgi:Dyp-type peroxidase family
MVARLPRVAPWCKTGQVVDLDWDDIQGNVLRGYGFDHAFHVVLSVEDPEPARRLLRRLVSAVTPCTPWFSRPDHTLNVAFTHRGLAALGAGEEALASFPEAFQEGMRARADEQLGDVGPDAPDRWEAEGVWHPSAHVLLMVHADSPDVCDQQRSVLVADALDNGFSLVGLQAAAHLSPATEVPGSWRQVEHFGFADGVSQPAVEGALGRSVVEGNGTPLPDGSWRPVKPGEFVLGYADEEEDTPPLPAPEEFSRNGSFLVYRKLAQDVAGWRRMVAERAARHGLSPDLLAAKLMGRYADGAPLEHPDHSLEELGDDERAWDNDFRYRGDLDGRSCPVGSHIRRANPRDGLDGLDPRLVSRHRLLRRGMPYGPPLPPGTTEDDGVDRGLLFLAYCADISRQFEFVQREWLNDGNVFRATSSWSESAVR